jgi:hypothetical protein
MSDILKRVQSPVAREEVEVSRHGFRELAADDILLGDVLAGVAAAVPIEEYPEFVRGPSILVLQHDRNQRPVHIVWGIPKGRTSPAVIVTAYRPDPGRWSEDLLRRRR